MFLICVNVTPEQILQHLDKQSHQSISQQPITLFALYVPSSWAVLYKNPTSGEGRRNWPCASLSEPFAQKGSSLSSFIVSPSCSSWKAKTCNSGACPRVSDLFTSITYNTCTTWRRHSWEWWQSGTRSWHTAVKCHSDCLLSKQVSLLGSRAFPTWFSLLMCNI